MHLFGMHTLKTLVETWSTLVDTMVCLDIVCMFIQACMRVCVYCAYTFVQLE